MLCKKGCVFHLLAYHLNLKYLQIFNVACKAYTFQVGFSDGAIA